VKWLLTVLVLAAAVCAEETVWERHKERFYESACKVIEAGRLEKDMKRWNVDMDERVESRSFTTIAVDWYFDNERALASKNERALKEAIFIFVRFYKTGENLPWQISERLTDENVDALINWAHVVLINLETKVVKP